MPTETIRIYVVTIEQIRIEVAGNLIITMDEFGRHSWEASLLTHESLAGLALLIRSGEPSDVAFEGEARGRAFVSFGIRSGIGGAMMRIQARGAGDLERNLRTPLSDHPTAASAGDRD
jgi:hypothetical protein